MLDSDVSIGENLSREKRASLRIPHDHDKFKCIQRRLHMASKGKTAVHNRFKSYFGRVCIGLFWVAIFAVFSNLILILY